ncbi:MAG: hypothetical protein II377_03945, partial [Clostridia bacterium]|nr:hypothetical protein [Clostridia bacterium]
MKRYTALVLLFLMLILSLSACDGGGEVSDASKTEESEEKEYSKPETSKGNDESEVIEEPYVPDTNEHGAFRISSIDDFVD